MEGVSQQSRQAPQSDLSSWLQGPHADPLELCIKIHDAELSDAVGSRHSRSPPIDIPGNESPSDSFNRFRPIGRLEEDLVLHLSKRVQALERELVLLKSHVHALPTKSSVTGLSRSSPF